MAESLCGPELIASSVYRLRPKLPSFGGGEVPWHQDAQYWPLAPKASVTMWIAFYDSDESNGAMQVVAGSHRGKEYVHHQVEGEQYTLQQAIEAGNRQTRLRRAQSY